MPDAATATAAHPARETASVYAVRDRLLGREYWYEVTIPDPSDPGEDVVIQTDGMYATACEAVRDGRDWVASAAGQDAIRAARTYPPQHLRARFPDRTPW